MTDECSFEHREREASMIGNSFLSISARGLLGKLLRLPLRIISPGTVVPILATRARGKKWIAGSGPHSCWLGFNEISKRRAFSARVKPGDVVYDIGANVGSYTILGAVLVGSSGRVFAFEPVPENVRYLREHVRLNALTQVEIFEAAVSDRNGTVRFEANPDRVLGRINPDGQLVVKSVVLDELLKSGGLLPPNCLKIDVEGGETGVLRGAREILEKVRPVVFVATHGPEVHRACTDLLGAARYSVATIGNAKDELLALPR
jgi:FkbM family methyltransferase